MYDLVKYNYLSPKAPIILQYLFNAKKEKRNQRIIQLSPSIEHSVTEQVRSSCTCRRCDQTKVTESESHSRVPEGYVWS